MAIISKPYRFSTGVIDPDRLNANEDTVYTAINGNLDSSNIADGGIEAENLNDTISPILRWGETFRDYVVDGFLVINTGLDCSVEPGTAYISGNRLPVSGSGHTVSDDTTTYCDLSSDGTFSWNSNASPLAGYLRLAKIVSATGDCTITDMRTFSPLAIWDLESAVISTSDSTTASATYATLLSVTMLDVEVGDTLVMALSGNFSATTNALYATFNFNVGGAAQTVAPVYDIEVVAKKKTITFIDLYAVTAAAASLVVNLQWKTSAATLNAHKDASGIYVLRMRPTR